MKLLISSLLVLAIQVSAFASDRPNIIVVLADDLGYSDLGCYGGEIPTPHIDALAKGGVRFTQMYNSARCCPTRASLMTGLYPTQAGIGDFTTNKPTENKGPGYLGRLRDDCATMAEMLKAASYRTYYSGKWHMHSQTGPIERGFDEFYGYTNDHSHDQYDRDYYERLSKNRTAELKYDKDKYYATDAFNDYALEFIRQGQKSGSPWLVFLGHSSPHFPVQAPADRVDKFEQMYLKGWDKLREERFARMQKIGLASGPAWKLSPRSIVPVDKSEIANGYPGEENPAWEALPEDRRRDLARRMAVFAAMVEGVDQGVGRIVQHLKETKDLDNTLILFTSDNGACYEWGPFGFDGISRKGETTLYTGDRLREIGGPGTHHSYGSAWANLGNTPLRMYKHFTHEGGINSPFIAHWPKGFAPRADWVHHPVHVMDIVPTILAAANVQPLAKLNEVDLQPIEGTNLLPAMRGENLDERGIGFDHQGARAWRKGNWKIVWSKRMPTEVKWELYNLSQDRCEMNDLAAKHPDRVEKMVAEWTQWAKRVGVIWEPGQNTSSETNPAVTTNATNQEKIETPNSGTINNVQVQTAPVESKPKAKNKQERPLLSELITEWGEKVTAENAWREYPRPLFVETSNQAAKADQLSPDAFVEKPTDRKLPRVWIYTDMSDPTLPGTNHRGTINDPDDVSAMAGYLLMANRFETLGIVVASTHRKEHAKSPDQAAWANERFGKAYRADLPQLQQSLGGYPADIQFVQSCIKESAEKFEEQKQYASLDEYSTVKSLFDTASKLDDDEVINVLCWGSLTEPAILVAHCLTTKNQSVLKKLRFIAHWTNSPLHQGSPEHPEDVANCREDAVACRYMKAMACSGKIVYHECGAIGQHGIVSGSPKGKVYFDQFRTSQLGTLFVEGKFVHDCVDHSDSATYWVLLGDYGVSLKDVAADGTNSAEIEKVNESKFAANSQKIHDELLKRVWLSKK